MARALIDRPDLLVLDEPAQGVDVSGAVVFHELIEEVRRTLGCGILMISHDIELAAQAGDDVVVLVPHEHDEPPAAGGNGGAQAG